MECPRCHNEVAQLYHVGDRTVCATCEAIMRAGEGLPGGKAPQPPPSTPPRPPPAPPAPPVRRGPGRPIARRRGRPPKAAADPTAAAPAPPPASEGVVEEGGATFRMELELNELQARALCELVDSGLYGETPNDAVVRVLDAEFIRHARQLVSVQTLQSRLAGEA